MASGHADVRVVVPEGAAAPATVPPGIFASAAGAYRSGQRLDMQSLARQAGVGRATLYRRVGNREQLPDEGIWWRARTGSPWRDVPERYGPWETSYTLFRRWQIDGTWARILKKLQVKADAAGHLDCQAL